MSNDAEFSAAVAAIESNLFDTGEAAFAEGLESGLPSKADLCAKYNKIKPFLETILPVIEKIPMFGKAVAGAIRLLMMIADSLCG